MNDIGKDPKRVAKLRKRIDGHLVSLAAPGSYESEQFRTLRYVLEQRRGSSGCLVVAVSSALPGDGKSLTAANLAGSLAQNTRARVLLLDADIRRHSQQLSRNLGLGRFKGRGLVEAIQEDAQMLGEFVHTLEPLNVSVMFAGTRSAAPYEIFSSPRFDALMARLRRHFDFVIVDTPPVVPISDCRVISGNVDGFVIVVAAHRTPRALLAEALDLIGPERTIGLVFNESDELLMRYHNYGYHGYGRLVREEPEARRTWLQEMRAKPDG